jgi:hypothetical protein
MSDHGLGHAQRIEKHVRDSNHRDSVLATLEKEEIAKRRIADTFGSTPSLVIVYQGLKLGMTQPQVAQALKDRGLPGGTQPQVSVAEGKLEEAGFLRQPKKGRRVVREGWDEFGIDRAIAKILKQAGIAKLA